MFRNRESGLRMPKALSVYHGRNRGSCFGCFLVPACIIMLLHGSVTIRKTLRFGFSLELWWLVFPLLLAGTGAGGLTYMAVRAWKRRARQAAGHAPSEPLSPAADESTLVPAATGSGPVVLDPERSRFQKFLLILFFTTFWNGVLYLGMSKYYQDWLAGEANWSLIIPFAIMGPVGVGLLFLVPYTFWKMFIPRPILELSHSETPLGEFAELSWRFAGNSSSIRHLTISIGCEERATYRHGTDTHTDASILLKQTLVDTRLKSEIHAGNVTVEIPHDGMHTLHARNNKVVWFFVVHGMIDNSPDVFTHYPFSVVPHSPSSAS